jgi:acyl-CoA synthetase (AMP-forming)/AMP-acid ligase II
VKNSVDEKVPVFRFHEVVDRFGVHPALVSVESVIRYREFAQQVAEAAAELKSQQVKNGDRVAIFGPNSTEYLSVLMALWQIGAIAVPLNTRFPERQLSELLERAGCQKLVYFQKYPDARYSMLDTRCSSTPTERPAAEDSPAPSGIPDAGFFKIPNIRHPASGIRYHNNAESLSPFEFSEIDILLQRDATIIFTSGSSGEPRAALHTFGNHL